MKPQKIPIQNLYFLLSYVWNKLAESDEIQVLTEENLTLPELLTKVLTKGINLLFKRGLDKNYIPNTQIYQGIKGKVNLTRSFQQSTFSYCQSVCDFDEFSANILSNQILKTTVGNLLRCETLDAELKAPLQQIWFRFSAVQTIVIQSDNYHKVRFHRNNQHYAFLMNVCQMLNENLLPNEQTGEFQFRDFVRDERQMAHVFEAFIRRFYEIEQNEFRVRGSEIIHWQFLGNQEDINSLPKMKTDITLENKTQKIIIDAKFYTNPLSGTKIHSHHLYQLFAYLKNQENSDISKTISCQGILLYASVNQDFDFQYQYEKHSIRVCSINLNTSIQSIKDQLFDLIFCPLTSE